MSILDCVARAEVSSDLSHKHFFCDVDILGAVGYAAIHDPGKMAIYRVKYLHSIPDMQLAKSTFILWSRRAMIRRGINPASASRVGVQTLMRWLNDTCNSCNGLGHKQIDGTPSLSSKTCGACDGSGRSRIRVPGELGEAVRDVLERADDAIILINLAISAKIG